MWELEIKILVDKDKKETQTIKYTFNSYWGMVNFAQSHDHAVIMPCSYTMTNIDRWSE